MELFGAPSSVRSVNRPRSSLVRWSNTIGISAEALRRAEAERRVRPLGDLRGNLVMHLETIAISFALAATAIGCASATRSGFLTDYARLRSGSHLEKYWSDRAIIESKNYSTIGMAVIDVTRISDKSGVTAEQCATWLKAALQYNSGKVRSGTIFATDQTEAELRIAITEMTPGSSAGRLSAAGKLGMGHAIVQVEGRMVDLASGKDLVAFADRRRSSGALGTEDFDGDAGPRLVRRMLEQIAADLVRELQQSGL